MTRPTRPSRTSPDAARVARLHALADQPVAQARYATQLLGEARIPDAVAAALAVLTARPPADLRALLLAKYRACDADGVKRDPGGLIRIQLLGALRPLALPEDTSLLERAAATYEFLFGEATGDLRAAALLALNEADDRLVEYHCVRLLIDEYTSEMSGEPALTAARILASHDRVLPLYAYVTQAERTVPDVVAECLRSLAAIPASLLPALVGRYRASEEEIVLLGVFDLILAHESRADYTDFVFDFLRDTALHNIYRYLVSVLIAGRAVALIDRLAALARTERDPEKRAILREALALR
jgi:hypothetical protein